MLLSTAPLWHHTGNSPARLCSLHVLSVAWIITPPLLPQVVQSLASALPELAGAGKCVSPYLTVCYSISSHQHVLPPPPSPSGHLHTCTAPTPLPGCSVPGVSTAGSGWCWRVGVTAPVHCLPAVADAACTRLSQHVHRGTRRPACTRWVAGDGGGWGGWWWKDVVCCEEGGLDCCCCQQ
jgi:hypothetical protein